MRDRKWGHSVATLAATTGSIHQLQDMNNGGNCVLVCEKCKSQSSQECEADHRGDVDSSHLLIRTGSEPFKNVAALPLVISRLQKRWSMTTVKSIGASGRNANPQPFDAREGSQSG
eukprot:6194447-Pleurochrysis_carterae.AAC.4